MNIRAALASAFQSSAPSRPADRPGAWVTATYEASVHWEEYVDGELRSTRIAKQVRIRLSPPGPSRVVNFRTTQPILTQKEEVEHLQRLALLLSGLYAELEMEITPKGEFGSLLNYPQLLVTWANLRGELLANSSPDDAITRKLIELFDAQLEQPAKVLQSLRHDYVYQAVLACLAAPALDTTPSGSALREFSQFFPQVSLLFTETRELAAVEEGVSQYTLRGTPDNQQTDLAAVRQAIQQALATNPAAAPLPPDAPEEPLHLGYEATYALAPADGLPLNLTLTVYGRLAQRYNKQYTLTLTRLP